ncbi:MAG: HU family DNA-binding protein [Deinococcales bacterium]|nr:HU family DNA-binding protein [Deinococcales bacterium]
MAKSTSRTVSKADLVSTVAEGTALKKKDVKAVLDAVLDQISTHLGKGNKVQLTGFGTFEVRSRKARKGVRPGTTERIDIPASTYPAFKPGKGLKDQARG